MTTIGHQGIPLQMQKRHQELVPKPENAILDYQEGYRKGVEKFGVWWKVFHKSMWVFVLVFFVKAALILIFYVPKLEML